MGAQCVRPNLRDGSQHGLKQPSSPYRLRGMDDDLNFLLKISNLELHCAPKQISRISFAVHECFQVNFTAAEFSIHDTMVKSTKQKTIPFEALAKRLEFLDFVVSIWDGKGSIVEVVSLKLHAVCEGPQHHDHLLKQMKARIIYNLEISQVISSEFSCSNFEVQESPPSTNPKADYGFAMQLIIPDHEDPHEQNKVVYFPKNPEEVEKLLMKKVSMNLLKKSLLRITILKFPTTVSSPVQEIEQFCIPYLQFFNQDVGCVVTEKKGSKQFEKRKIKYQTHIRCQEEDSGLKVKMQFTSCTSKVYLEQLDCLVFSEKGFDIVSPHQLSKKTSPGESPLTIKDLAYYEVELKKVKSVTYKTKQSVQKTLKQCYHKLIEKDGKTCLLTEVQEVQVTLVNLIKILSNLITEGQDMTNESIWILINKIIHRPELTTRYLSLVDEQKKSEIGLKHFQFLIVLLQKIIHCTEVGLTYHELKCIQKFIAYAFFRYKWIRDIVVGALSRPEDPILTPEKLMEIGVFAGCKSPSKGVIFDWEHLMNSLKKDHKYKSLEDSLAVTSLQNPEWAELIFNRDDQDLFYGLVMEIWTQAQIFLSNQGRIQWQYFPCYAELLGAFLGQMNKNQIKEYSTQFRECSIKLISNEKLLNSFVALLFPKTCLYETYCVIKCLELLNCYFQAISLQNKRIPAEFNFNYFYTGIKSIFESNHSYLLLKVISLLYDYYHIFSNQFQKSLDMYIFDRNFFRIFLHWCGHVRRIFYLLLEHKIAAKFRETKINQDNSSRSFPHENTLRLNQYKGLLEKLKEEDERIKYKKEQNPRHSLQNEYFRKMKGKLHLKRQNHLQKKGHKEYQMSSSCHNSPPPMRKSQLGSLDQVRLSRKWSVNMDEDTSSYQTFSEEHMKYIPIAMREYADIKNLNNPDKEIRKIMKIFEGGKSADI